MEVSIVASSEVSPREKAVSVVHDVARETETGKNAIANRLRLAEVRTACGTEAASRSVRYKNFTVLGGGKKL